MYIFSEGIHQKLRGIFHAFDDYCKQNNIFYGITIDEYNIQGYLIKDKDSGKIEKIVEFLKPHLGKDNVHIEKQDRKDGTLLTFTLNAIQDSEIKEDGHWDVLKGHPGGMGGSSQKPKERQFTIFADKESARKVKAGKTPIQKGGIKSEDQYKFSSSKHTRAQSPFRSSFAKSKSFGGVRSERMIREIDRTLKEEFENTEKESLSSLVVLMDNYARLMNGQINKLYEPWSNNPEELWGDLLIKLDEFRNSAISVESQEFVDDFFKTITTWKPDDKFGREDQDDKKWRIDPMEFEKLYKKALENADKTETIKIILGHPLDMGEEPSKFDIEISQKLGEVPDIEVPPMQPLGEFGPVDKGGASSASFTRQGTE